jgi:hypothetical protein
MENVSTLKVYAEAESTEAMLTLAQAGPALNLDFTMRKLWNANFWIEFYWV